MSIAPQDTGNEGRKVRSDVGVAPYALPGNAADLGADAPPMGEGFGTGDERCGADAPEGGRL